MLSAGSKNWTIDALRVGELKNVPSDAVHFQDRTGRRVDVPFIMFVLRSEDDTIVVDTGGPTDISFVTDRLGWEYECTEDMYPAVALGRLGVNLEDVSLVVNTHLHWDHSANNGIFPNAKIVIQLKELEHAVRPDPSHIGSYGITPGLPPAWTAHLDRVYAVKGRKEIAPGVAVVPLPGHTPGSQGVLVQTSAGPHIITGDCLDDHENWEAAGGPKPSGSYTNLPDFFDSLAFLKESGWTPIPSHDHSVVARGRFG